MSEHSNGPDREADENALIARRREKLAGIRRRRQAWPNGFRPDNRAAELIAAAAGKDREELARLAQHVTVAGRILRRRGPFLVIQDGSGQIQLWLSPARLSAEQAQEVRDLDLGDIIGAAGELFRTGKGELSVRVDHLQLMVKSLRPLPDKYRGLHDTELRYRRRYLDLIVNRDSRRVFEMRSQIIRFLRGHFEELGFLEVETPMLHNIPGGAMARPFVTHHNALDLDMYLRVAPELFLKRLLVGGFERVFELNRCFRNEGLSTRHNPEFTMLEFYQAWATYEDLMDLTEDLFRRIAKEVVGSAVIEGEGVQYDFSRPFARMTLAQAVERYGAAQSGSGTAGEATAAGPSLLERFEQEVEGHLQQPTFITGFPIDASPLARRNDADPELADRFELFIGGRELANGFSELNDPEDQQQRFRVQARRKDSGDAEAMQYDEDYITALEYGLPPAAGEGIGIDRLVMLFTGVPTIKDVLLFPHLRPRHGGN